MSKYSIEEKYQKIDHHEHILKRGNMYIGSIKKETKSMWIYNENRNENEAKIHLKEITYVPGLYKIYDEILVNARDHVIRCLEEKREACTIIKVNIDKENNKISVWNNGAGIEIVEHKKHKILIPSLIFGELLSGTNYNDEEKRKVGGMNGLGAKLTNIYSSEFEVETLDSITNKKFYQKFSNNMYTKGKPQITSGKGKKPYTKISFIPDFEKFGMKGLTTDIINLFRKRVYDIAMTTNVKVYYNDELITENSFTKYIDLYFPTESEHKKIIDVSNGDWKICIIYDPTDTLEHQNISFVNGISTSGGGTHVDHVFNQIVSKLKTSVEQKVKNLIIKPSMIKENLIIFMDTILVNPEFDTQTKEKLITKVSDFSTTYNVSDKLIKNIIKTGVVDNIVANALALAEAKLQKSGKNKEKIEKLYPAHKSTIKDGYKCTLILTEGDSAKTFAMSGLNVTERDYYGVFPLRGKLLNVRGISTLEIIENEEIKSITQIIGLEYKKVYTDTKGLRYGSIMILTDQDVDGSHIKGLIMNFIHYFWPSLAKLEGFIRCLATPLLKITKGKGKNEKVLSFISMPEYEKWKKENNDGKGWGNPKYYKGLGTNSQKEAQECFQDIDQKLINYFWKSTVEQDNDTTLDSYKPKCKDITNDAITLAFDKKRSNDRKEWLNTYDPNKFIDNANKRISYYDFIHKELIAFSVYDVQRSIPNIIDGFKPSQRKVYFGSIEENIYKEEIKVAQLSGAIAKRTAYHHGEQSLNETIIAMAQNFVGKNNINLLKPNGQFGSRLQGGKDAASPRYIFTQLDELGKKIFIEEDFDVLEHQTDEGKQIEPLFFVPIIPMILVNGTEGIGTGYSTNIEPCNPRDIFLNLKRIIAGEKPKAMMPWYRHFTGKIEKVSDGKYICRANYEIIDDNTIHITDLPIGIWTDDYKSFLDNLLNHSNLSKTEEKKINKNKNKSTKKNSKTSKKKKNNSGSTAKVSKKNKIGSFIKNYKEDCTDIRISFVINFYPGKLKELMNEGKLEKDLKLVVPLNLTNMHLFDEKCKIRKYNTYGAILRNFAKVRLELYQKRKDYLLDKWKKEMDILKWKVKFILDVRSGKIIIFDIRNNTSKRKDEVINRLEELKYPKFIINNATEASYNYITTTGLFNLTVEEVDKIKKQLEDKKEEIAILEGKSPSEMWIEELDQFMEAYEIWEENIDNEYYALLQKKMKKNKSKK